MESVHSIETAQAVSSTVQSPTQSSAVSPLQNPTQNPTEMQPSCSDTTVNTCQIFDATPADINPFLSGTHEAIHEAIPEAIQEPIHLESAAMQASSNVLGGQRGIVGADDRVSKRDLVSLLEGFVRIIKTDDTDISGSGSDSASASGSGSHLSASPAGTTGTRIDLAHAGLVVNEARIDDRTVEIDQLRGLVIEAQDTIIKLLTDRVEDRSRIATLEAQLSLLPDLQAQADRAMSVAVRTEEYRGELNKMKFELDRFRLFRVRVEAENRKATVFNRIQKWLFSRPNAADETLQNKN